MKLLVQRKLASLSECLSATLVGAFKWFLTCVNIRVLFQVLAKRKLLIANVAGEGFGWSMSRNMTP
jgi:hypothetical protein